MNIQEYVEGLSQKALRSAPPTTAPAPQKTAAVVEQPLESVLKDRAIELWSTTTGRLFLVADDADARRAMAQFGARRGEIYTAAEARRIVAVNDPAVIAEIHEWKKQFDGDVREFRRGIRTV